MATNPEFMGLLGQYGLGATPEDLRKAELLKQQKTALSLVNNMGFERPADQGMAQVGGLLAAALGNRGYQIPDAEMRKIATANQAKQMLDEWLAANKTASPKDRADKYQEFLATSAFQNGLPEIGAPILDELTTKKLQRQTQETALEEAGLRLDRTKATHKSGIAKDLIENSKAGIIEFYPAGSRDPNSALTGVYNPADMSVRTSDGKVYQLGQWKTDRPQFDPKLSLGGGGSGSKFDKLLDEYGIAKSEAGAIRASQMASYGQMQSMAEIDDLFTEALNAGRPVNFTSDYGKLAQLGERWTNFAGSLAESVSPTNGVVGKIDLVDKGKTFNLDSASDRLQYTQQYLSEIKKLMPANMAADAQYADRYASLIVDLAYATARAAEPGAKALTNEDFKRAMQVIGGNMSNPETLRKIMFTKAMKTTQLLDQNLAQFPEEVRKKLIGDEAWENYNVLKEDLVRRMGHGGGQTYGDSYGQRPRAGGPSNKPRVEIISVTPAN